MPAPPALRLAVCSTVAQMLPRFGNWSIPVLVAPQIARPRSPALRRKNRCEGSIEGIEPESIACGEQAFGTCPLACEQQLIRHFAQG